MLILASTNLEYLGAIKMKDKDEISSLKYLDVNKMRDKVPKFLWAPFNWPQPIVHSLSTLLAKLTFKTSKKNNPIYW